MKHLGIAVLVLLVFDIFQACTCGAELHEVLAGPTEWSMQPAVNPDTPPKEGDSLKADYTKNQGWNIRNLWNLTFRNGKKQGLSWEKANFDEINSVWYETNFSIPISWKDRRVILDFTSLGGDAVVFVNGTKIGELLNPDCEIDVTSAMNFEKSNRLSVYFTRDYTGISRGYEKDKFQYQIEHDSWNGGKSVVKDRPLGPQYPLRFISRPATAVTDVFAIPSWKNKRIDFEIETVSDKKIENAVLSADILDADGKTAMQIKSNPQTIPAGHSVHKIGADWNSFRTWELESPYLYKVQVELKCGERVADKPNPVRFGFREVWTEGRKFMMNGHPMRWRQMHPQGISNLAGVSFARLMGYNFFFTSSVGPKERFDRRDEKWLDLLDEQGFGTNHPIVPQLTALRGSLTKDPEMLADYERHAAKYLKTIRNHPSIMAWYVGYNSFCPTDHINPQGLGRPASYYETAYQVKFINAAYDAIKRIDPTRLVYSHADGATGDIASSNIYLNFAPLQEREEWPVKWAENGTHPYMAAEMGTPITSCFWKNNYAFIGTEYCAIYQGDDAYKNESEAGLRKNLDLGLRNKTWGLCKEMDFEKDFHNMTDLYRLFVKNTNRAWRTWGIPGGWLYFDFDLALGFPKGKTKNWYEFSVYNGIKEVPTSKPEWATEFYDIHSEANKTLLAYIAGVPLHTDKTHAYYSGAKISKQVAVVYDGSVDKKFKITWKAVDAKGADIASGSKDIQMSAGAIAFHPVTFNAPSVTAKTSCRIRMTLTEDGREIQSDSFDMQIFPPFNALKLDNKKIAVYDPAGKSAKGLASLGVIPSEWKIGAPNKGISLLIVGRESISPTYPLPYTKEDVKNGLSVLILEQKPEIWEAMGLRTIEAMPRYVFMNDRNHPVVKELAPEDLINWSGTPDLLPEFKAYRPHDMIHAPKCTNTQTVASTAIQVPEAVGFKPILSCEFDMNYSPLLQWLDGKGQIVFCSLDISDRIGHDPAATALAGNLMSWMTENRPSPRREYCYYWGNAAGKDMLEQIKVKIDNGMDLFSPAKTVLIIGSDGEGLCPAQDKLTAFIRKGGRVFYLQRSGKDLMSMGLETEPKDIVRTLPPAHPLFQGIGQNLLRWRDSLKIPAVIAKQPKDGTVLGEGLFLISENDKGGILFISQMNPMELEERHRNNKPAMISVGISIVHMRQLMAQILTNMGTPCSEKSENRLTALDMGADMEVLAGWQVLGPFPVSKDDGKLMLDTKFPGEETAIKGDTNPNLFYHRQDGVALDWRGTAKADADGFVDFARTFNFTESGVAYATRIVPSEKARTARMMLGARNRMAVWVNGELVFRTMNSAPGPVMCVDVPLKAGENIISVKVGSGYKGFGFFASISKPELPGRKVDAALRDVKLYDIKLVPYDPYEFIYW